MKYWLDLSYIIYHWSVSLVLASVIIYNFITDMYDRNRMRKERRRRVKQEEERVKEQEERNKERNLKQYRS